MLPVRSRRKADSAGRVNTPGARAWMSTWMRSLIGLGPPPNSAGKRCLSSTVQASSDMRACSVAGAAAASPSAGRSLTAAPAQPGGSSAHAKYPVLNGKGEIHRSVELTLKRGEFSRARRFLLNLRIEDEDRQVVDAIRDLPIEIQDAKSLERVLLQLNVALKSKD